MVLVYIILLGAIIAITEAKTIKLPVNPIELIDSSIEIKKSEEQNSIVDPLSDEFIDAINQLNTTWKAGRNFSPNITIGCLKNMAGLLTDIKPYKLPQLITKPLDFAIPEVFDSRVKWSTCETIREIRNQGCCGSCWAVAAVEAMSDRICIHSKGKFNFHLSAQDLISCCKECGNGCDGGYSAQAWVYWAKHGIVSGGNYGTKEGCVPYTIAPCENNQKSEPTPACKQTCEFGYNVDYKSDLHFGMKAFWSEGSEKAMKREIYQHGPIEGSMTVYEDFYHYKSGVYQYVRGKKISIHSVKIIGWGFDKSSNTQYWLVANSWGTTWGEEGFFRIKRGVNEVGIENVFYGGFPRL